jgi:zinc transporter, ZIP family
MENLGASLGWGLVIGGSLVLGAAAAALLRLPERIAATLTAFGGGILLAAIALELVPEADRQAGSALTAGRPMTMGTSEAMRGESIAVGLFVDGVPESIALGLTIAEGEIGVALLAGVLVGNVVEAYGATQPIIVGGRTRRFAITLLTAIGFALAFATVLGGTVLADASGELVGTAQAVAGGAVLAVVSIAIVPHAFSEVNRLVATATVAGFIAGYLLS